MKPYEKTITPKKTLSEIEQQSVQQEINIARKLSKSMYDSPEKWEHDEYRFYHKKINFVLWISNGKDFFKQYITESKGKPDFIVSKEICQKILWESYLDWKLGINNKSINKLSNTKFSVFSNMKQIFQYLTSSNKSDIKLLEYKPEEKVNFEK